MNQTQKLYITDKGDPSVGIFPQTWTIECPWSTKDSGISNEDKEFFKTEIEKLYKEFAEGEIVYHYDNEMNVNK